MRHAHTYVPMRIGDNEIFISVEDEYGIYQDVYLSDPNCFEKALELLISNDARWLADRLDGALI